MFRPRANVRVRVQVSSRGGGRYGGVTEGGRRGDNESFRRTRIGLPCCTVDREAQIKENLVCVPDIRAHMESALTNLSDKMVCSVGVQVGETLLSHHQGMFIGVNNSHFSSCVCSLVYFHIS